MSAPERMSCAVGRAPDAAVVGDVVDLIDAARAGAPPRMTMLRRPLPSTAFVASLAQLPAKPERAP